MSPGRASRASITLVASAADRNLATPASRAEPPASAVTTLIQARALGAPALASGHQLVDAAAGQGVCAAGQTDPP